MQTVKTLTNRDYQEYLLSALSDPERIASNIEVVLEDKDHLSGLLRLTLTDIFQAKIKDNTLTDDNKLCFERLDQILANTDGKEIYALVDFLSTLGLKISIININ